MGAVFLCDRCGKEYRRAGEKIRIPQFRVSRVFAPGVRGTKYFDICEDCEADLLGWLKAKGMQMKF